MYPRAAWFVVRDERDTELVWHVLDAWDLLAEIDGCEPQLPLREAIDSERHRADVRKVSERKRRRSTQKHAVVLDGTEVVGVVPGEGHAVIPGVYRDWMPTLRASDPASAPRTRFFAWPSVTAPVTAVPLEEIVLTIALSRDQGRSASPIHVELLPDEKEFDLEVDVAAVGFDAPGGWRRTLHIDAARDHHSISFPLRVRPDAPPGRGLVHVAFLKGGMVCGNATCQIAIGSGNAPGLASEISPCILPEADEEPADLLVMIRKADGNSATGRYVWSMSSTCAAIDPQPFPIDLGDDARTFARSLMRDVVETDGTALLQPILRAVGKEIAARIPSPFWDALRIVAAAVASEQRPPSILLCSAEEFVPWELALMESPLSEGPPYLGAQAIIGRWLHSQSGVVPMRPSSSIPVKDVAVLAPDYQTRSFARLDRALAEAKYMVETHGAIAINATEDEVRRLLDAQVERSDGSPAEISIVHFAGHGSGDPTRPGSGGVFLVNGKRLGPRVFAASMLGHRFGPMLFINACEAGMAQRLLDDNAGFAAISLRGGFRGFIA
ncbi:MAG: CHAT domain-containing protein, partial [Steroidobacteraceae bacterium]